MAQPASTLQDNYGIGEALLDDATYGKSIGTKGQPDYIPGLQDVKAAFDAGNLALAADLLAKTKWAKLDSDAQSRYLEKIQKSDVYKEHLNSWLIGVKQQLAAKGLKADDATLTDYYNRGIDTPTILNELSTGVSAKGATGAAASALNELRRFAKANGFDLETDFADKVDGWLQNVSKGTPLADIEQQIRDAATAGITSPYVKKRLTAGENLTDIYAPYLQAMADKFGITNIDEIDLKDPILANVFTDKGGMNLTKFGELLNADSRAKAALGQAQVGNIKQYIKNYSIQKGYALDDAAIQRIIDTATSMGILNDSLQLNDLINKEFTYKPGQQLGGFAGNALQALTATAAANGLDLQKDFGANLNDWLGKIAAGEQVSTFENTIRQTAKIGLPPEMQKLLDQGINLDAVLSPYKNAMSSVLELPADSIQLKDILDKAVKDNAFASIYDFKRSLRKDPRWQYTDNARADVSNSVLGVLRDFGFQG